MRIRPSEYADTSSGGVTTRSDSSHGTYPVHAKVLVTTVMPRAYAYKGYSCVRISLMHYHIAHMRLAYIHRLCAVHFAWHDTIHAGTWHTEGAIEGLQ